MTALGLTNPQVQRLRRLLGRRSARLEEGAFVIEGALLLAEAVAAGVTVESVFVGPGVSVDAGDARVEELAPGVAERIASTVSPRPVLAVARRTDVALDAIAGQGGFVVIAAGVADPGNLGTILRSAEAAGADGVVVTTGSVDVFNPKVVRASAGALFRMPVAVEVGVGALRALGVPLLGTAATGGVAYDVCAELGEACAIVLGSEAHGLPGDLAVDELVTIPHAGRAESLNVAMAASILCFEAARRRRIP